MIAPVDKLPMWLVGQAGSYNNCNKYGCDIERQSSFNGMQVIVGHGRVIQQLLLLVQLQWKRHSQQGQSH